MDGDLFPEQARMISLILLSVADTGVRRRKLYFEDFEEPEENRGLFVDCVYWLAAEEIIGVENMGTQGRFSGCSLRSKGFALMQRQIQFGGDRLMIRDISHQVKSGRIDRAAAGEFIGGLFAGAIKGFGSG
ncbi:hypothetical protein [Thalassovita aquimarina]|uniref:Uncharacterized protein n=1 Tax=Thalassovita aquimarina TaxID=2785917 RepID=A0ABS5HSJ1_9RHOB|nr:hypothetical protein [Thalassovita aquimarina]MBR9651939.1 hypothetical protein [Thalassovita aquimarina]